jgi:hypothetical protein
MNAMERIREIDELSNRSSFSFPPDEARFILRAFKVMRGIAVEWGGERVVAEEFEEAMKEGGE